MSGVMGTLGFVTEISSLIPLIVCKRCTVGRERGDHFTRTEFSSPHSTASAPAVLFIPSLSKLIEL